MLQNRVQGVIVPPDGLFFRDRHLIADLALQNGLPLIFWSRETVEAGGVASYGPSVPALFRRAAVYIDRILKGEEPGNLPVEQPNRYETIINLRVAKALGLEIPPTLLARADELIE
jgi:putative ABC transport system substrate-binding protein